MKYGLSNDTLREICAVLSRYPQVEQAVLYGSRAKGNYKTGSDIDVTLRGRGLTLSVLFRILEELDDLFLPYTFDLSIYEDIGDPDVVDHIRRVGVTIYTKGEAGFEPVTLEKRNI